MGFQSSMSTPPSSTSQSLHLCLLWYLTSDSCTGLYLVSQSLLSGLTLMTGTVEDGLSWLDFSVDLVMVFSLWVVKPQAMQLQTLFRSRLNLFNNSREKKQTNKYMFWWVSGTSTCEHLLGDITIWRIQEIVQKNICTSYQYALHVHSCSSCSYGLVRT